MPTLSELQQHASDAEHQAFQQAYDALLDIAKDPITCRHFWDMGRESLRRELEGQEPVAYGYPNTAITGKAMTMMMVRLDIPSDDQYGGAQWAPLYAAPPAPPDARELVEALELMIDTHENGGWPEATVIVARAALAKHRGQS